MHTLIRTYAHLHSMTYWAAFAPADKHRSVLGQTLDDDIPRVIHFRFTSNRAHSIIGGTAVQALPGLPRAEASAACHVNHRQRPHVAGSTAYRGDKMPASVLNYGNFSYTSIGVRFHDLRGSAVFLFARSPNVSPIGVNHACPMSKRWANYHGWSFTHGIPPAKLLLQGAMTVVCAPEYTSFF